MTRVNSVLRHGTAQAVVLAVVVFVVALAGHVPLGLAAALGAIMIAYGLLLLLGGRSEFISALARPSEDETAFAVHLRASALAGNVLAAVIVVAFLVELARATRAHSPGSSLLPLPLWPWWFAHLIVGAPRLAEPARRYLGFRGQTPG